jgi:glucose/arabinose dehydrogenase
MRFLLFLTASITSAFSQAQSDYYLREEIPLPKGEIMEISSIALMPDEKVAVATRRGDVWICEGAYGSDLSKVTWKKFTHGLHEPLGMYYQKGSLFLTQRPELSRIQDSDNDGTADVFGLFSKICG